MIRSVALVAFALLAAVPCARAQDEAEPGAPTRSVVVELKFSGPEDGAFRVERGNVDRVDRPAPKQYGTPQMEPLFIEVLASVEGSADKVAQFAMVVADPRFRVMETVNEDGTFKGSRVFSPEASLRVTVPDIPGAELVLYERVENGGEGQPRRRELFRTGL